MLDDELRDLITSEVSTTELNNAAAKTMKTLIHDAARKVDMGLITVDEVLRVLGPQVVI